MKCKVCDRDMKECMLLWKNDRKCCPDCKCMEFKNVNLIPEECFGLRVLVNRHIEKLDKLYVNPIFSKHVIDKEKELYLTLKKKLDFFA